MAWCHFDWSAPAKVCASLASGLIESIPIGQLVGRWHLPVGVWFYERICAGQVSVRCQVTLPTFALTHSRFIVNLEQIFARWGVQLTLTRTNDPILATTICCDTSVWVLLCSLFDQNGDLSTFHKLLQHKSTVIQYPTVTHNILPRSQVYPIYGC